MGETLGCGAALAYRRPNIIVWSKLTRSLQQAIWDLWNRHCDSSEVKPEPRLAACSACLWRHQPMLIFLSGPTIQRPPPSPTSKLNGRLALGGVLAAANLRSLAGKGRARLRAGDTSAGEMLYHYATSQLSDVQRERVREKKPSESGDVGNERAECTGMAAIHTLPNLIL